MKDNGHGSPHDNLEARVAEMRRRADPYNDLTADRRKELEEFGGGGEPTRQEWEHANRMMASGLVHDKEPVLEERSRLSGLVFQQTAERNDLAPRSDLERRYVLEVQKRREHEGMQRFADAAEKNAPHTARGKKQMKHCRDIASRGGQGKGCREERIVEAFRLYVTRHRDEGRSMPGITEVISHLSTMRAEHPDEYLPYRNPKKLFTRVGAIAKRAGFLNPQAATKWMNSLV